mgnify:CR=1 FL=1
MDIHIKESEVKAAAAAGMDDFVMLFHRHIMDAVGGTLDAKALQRLSGEQITLLAYVILRDEVMDGGFIQLIHNGYGGFIFLNPFAKAMRLWGLGGLSKLIYKGRKLFEAHADALTAECSDEDFMALYEQFPQFDDLDDEFVAQEEEWTAAVAHYVDDHLDHFAQIN